MSSDLQALLAAIVANPSDDVARLVYADCLEEYGNAPRAQFIRLQVEAERHHHNTNARAELEQQAHALFADHWVEWWGEVCGAVGFPRPTPKPSGRLGRLASRVGMGTQPGSPYRSSGLQIAQADAVPNPTALQGYSCCRFRRGFPDAVELSYGRPNFLPRWPGVSPIDSLTLHAPPSDDWIDEPHLAGLRELSLRDYDVSILEAVFFSPYCGNLEALHLEVPSNNISYVHFLASGLEVIFEAARTRRLKTLSIPVLWEHAAEQLAHAACFVGLKSLRLLLTSEYNDGRAAAGFRLAALASSVHLAGLKELAVVGGLDTAGIAAAIQNPTWTGLQKLELNLQYNHGLLDSLAWPDGLTSLDDLRLLGVRLDEGAGVLARASLLKRVRHFAFAGSPIDGTTLPKLAGAMDRDRLETFTLLLPRHAPFQEYAATLLHRWFGDRARVLLV